MFSHIPTCTVLPVAIAVALLGACAGGVRESALPKPATATVAPLAGANVTLRAESLLKERLPIRKELLEQQEVHRLDIVEKLPFKPREIVPGRPLPRLCLTPFATPASAIDPHRSLFVHDRATLDAPDATFGTKFTLKRTLDQIAGQVAPTVPGTVAASVFRQFWDTQNNAPGIGSGPHCGTVNDMPMECPRNEGGEASGSNATITARIDEYKPLALVNRIDLAHQGWRNCGEFRIIYGKRGTAPGKNLVIFEAVLPNPKPGCREGCVAVAEFWKSLSTINDANDRAQKLADFYYNGLPGFRPVVHVNHYSATGVTSRYGSSGSGQIRTNQFLQTGTFQPWVLKEFKTVIDCGTSPCRFEIVPTMVKVNPLGRFWNQDVAGNPVNPFHARAADFQADTLAQTGTLASPSLMGINYSVDTNNDSVQSFSLSGFPGFEDDYRTQMNGASATSFRIGLAVVDGPTADQMARRALTQSCAGCHMPSTFGLNSTNAIGTVTTPTGGTIDRWPNVVGAGFVHVDVMPSSVRPELAANPAAFGSGQGQEISPALLDVFLPERKNFLLTQLNSVRCTCVNRFVFLDDVRLRLALSIEERVQKSFDPRFEALSRKLTTLKGPSLVTGLPQIEKEHQVLIQERDRKLVAELKQNGITLPDADVADLKPQVMKLKAAGLAQGDVKRERELRIEEVNQILKQDPPRRTVTGSFRTH